MNTTAAVIGSSSFTKREVYGHFTYNATKGMSIGGSSLMLVIKLHCLDVPMSVLQVPLLFYLA